MMSEMAISELSSHTFCCMDRINRVHKKQSMLMICIIRNNNVICIVYLKIVK